MCTSEAWSWKHLPLHSTTWLNLGAVIKHFIDNDEDVAYGKSTSGALQNTQTIKSVNVPLQKSNMQ